MAHMLGHNDFIEKFNDMQHRTVDVTRHLASLLEFGQSEKLIADRYYELLAESGLVDHWYPALVYVGDSTSLPISRRYHLPSEDVILQENDIVMLDCTPLDGTVWSNWAETFVIGHDEFYESLVKDSKEIVDQIYNFTAGHAKTIGDIFNYGSRLINEYGFTSLDPMGDIGHSIFQVPEGQTVEKTPMSERIFIYPEHGAKKIEGIVSIEPQLGKKHPITGKMYSTKIQKVCVVDRG